MSHGLRPVPCPLCGANDPQIRFPARGAGAEELAGDLLACTSSGLACHGDVVRCRRCGMVYANPQPDPDELLALYAEVQDPTYVTQREGRVRTFLWLLDRLHRFVERPGALVDVGCYTGIFMELAAERGWQVSGIEPSRWAAAIARDTGVGPVHCGAVDEAPVAANSLDLVTMWDVIEHLADPAGMVEWCASVLRPGGLLALTTHMIDSPAARLMGTRYPFLMSMHLVHFSRATIRRLLADRGFEVLAIEGHRRTVMLDYLLDRIWSLAPALAALLRPLARIGVVRRTPVHVRGLGLVNVFARLGSS